MTSPTPPPAALLPGVAARQLADFGSLLPAEALLLQAAREGGIARIGLQRPRAAAPVVRVRADFLAWLAIGSTEVHVAGGRIQLLGACIIGTLDLRDCVVSTSLWLYRCVFVRAPLLSGAHIRGSLSFPDCGLPGLQAEGCRIDGELALNAGCNLYGEVQLTRAAIGLDLNGERMRLQPSEKFGYALPCRLLADGLRVGGSVWLRGGVEANGAWSWRGAHIHGDLDAGGARLSADLDESGTRGLALCLTRAVVDGSVRLNAGFSAAGRIDLERARIGGDLDCDDADFDAVGDAGWGGAAALCLDRARIGGALMLRRLHGPLQIASLLDARVNTLADDASTWGRQHRLDGFGYRRLAPGSPTDAAMRIGWLERQHTAALGADFKPEPWRRIIKVLRRAGHAHAASVIAIARERHLREAGRIGNGAPAPVRIALRTVHAAYGFFAGHGHRPMRLIAALMLLWLGCGGVYWTAATAGVMVPASSGSNLGLPRFHPFLFSLDVLLPGLDLSQARYWRPMTPSTNAAGIAWGVSAVIGFEALCGWLALAMGLVVASSAAARASRD